MGPSNSQLRERSYGKQGVRMKKQAVQLMSAMMVLLMGLGAQAQNQEKDQSQQVVGSRLCYVQKQGKHGIYAEVLGQIEIDAEDYESHVIYKDSNYLYVAQNSEGTDMITLSMFNPRNKNSLVIVNAGGDHTVTLINQPMKKLIGCTEIRK
jgi:hypothetical protein